MNSNSSNPNFKQAGKRKWYHEVWFVIAMLLAIGPFAFPLLWKSPLLGPKAKWWLTVLFVFLTLVVLWTGFESVKFTLKHFEEIRASLPFVF